jgi:hypothetical protein
MEQAGEERQKRTTKRGIPFPHKMSISIGFVKSDLTSHLRTRSKKRSLKDV